MNKHNTYIFNLIATISAIFLMSEPAYAETEYYRLEVIGNIHVFEEYIKLINASADKQAFKSPKLPDKAWVEASGKIRNNISVVNLTQNGHVLITNSKYKFELEFIPSYTGNQVLWSCKINQHSLVSYFFPLHECDNWFIKL